MQKIICTSVTVLAFVLQSITARAEETENTRQLSNVQILYVETQPAAEETGTPRGKVRELFKRFEPTSDGEKIAETLSMTDSTNQKAEKIVFDNGYLDVPQPTYESLIRNFSSYHVRSIPTFFSLARPKDQIENIKTELAKKYPAALEKVDYTLTLMPYRVSLQDTDDAVVWIGVLLYDTKINQNIWTHYISIPFGKGRKGFNEADGDRVASLLINEFLKKGWLKIKN